MYKGIISFLIMLQCFILAVPLSYATTQSPKQNIKVGIYPSKGFYELQENGVKSGYAIDYMEEIAFLNNWKIEYVEANIKELAALLLQGEVDILLPIVKTETLDALYSDLSLGRLYNTLFVPETDMHTAIATPQELDGMIIGLSSTNPYDDRLTELASNFGATVNIKKYDTEKELYEALVNFEIDALFSGIEQNIDGVRPVLTFLPDELYLAVNKNKPELLAKVNYAVAYINSENPAYEGNLTEKYFIPTDSYPPFFTEEELRYIKNSPELFMILDDFRSPLSYSVKEGGKVEYKGIFVDLTRLIAEKSGLKMEFHFVNSNKEAYSFASESPNNILVGVSKSTRDLRIANHRSNLVMSIPFCVLENVMVAKKGLKFDPSNPHVVAVTSTFSSAKKLVEEKYPSFQFKAFSTVDGCLDAVLNGDADVYMQTSFLIKERLLSPKYKSLEFIPYHVSYDERCFEMSDEVNPLLISIINKTIKSIGSKEYTRIVLENTLGMPFKLSTMDFIREYLLLILFVLTVFFYFLSHYVMKKKSFDAVSKVKTELEFLVDNVAGGITRVSNDEKLTFITTNKACYQLIGHTHEEMEHLFDNSFLAIVHAADRASVLNSLHEQLLVSNEVEFECRIKRSNEDIIWILFRGRIFTIDNNETLTCVFIDITAQKLNLLAIELQVQKDSLTGLYNKTATQAMAESILGISSACNHHALLQLDLDSFKTINDTFGHLFGDTILKEVADKLSLIFRKSDVVGRFGGDEYVVLLKDIPSKEFVIAKANQVCESLRMSSFDEKTNTEYKISASVGIALYPEDGSSYIELYEKADAAVYISKNRGKDCYSFYQSKNADMN